MVTTTLRREPRLDVPPTPDETLELQDPPGLPEDGPSLANSLMNTVPMALGSSGMMVMFVFFVPAGPMRWLTLGIMGGAMLAMVVGGLLRNLGERKRQLNSARREYLRYLSQMREKMAAGADAQRASLRWRHPDPDTLLALVRSRRLWERRVQDPDFLEARIGTGTQLPAIRLVVPRTKPLDDLEPLSALALRRFIEAWGTVEDLPVSVRLRSYARLLLRGDADVARGMLRAMLVGLATLHTPHDLRIVLCVSAEHLGQWRWALWLPHCQHPSDTDAAGPVRMLVDDVPALEELLGKDEMDERGAFEPGSVPDADEAAWLVLLDGVAVPETSRLVGKGYRNVTAASLGEALPWTEHPHTLRLDVEAGEIALLSKDKAGKDQRSPIGPPDDLSCVRARSVARQLAPFRAWSDGGGDATVLPAEVGLTTLLGAGEPEELDPATIRRGPLASSWLRVPIGVDDSGNTVELDIKEAALGGSGPHGMLVGATGSGKSELLRTLVLSMATCHSSESLNMVLVDFKGGATFLGLEGLPHVCAVITNLADELSLVDRMQDALHGELVRRQELLRSTGYASLTDYERARADGAALAPLPSLFLVVDEFSELLSVKRDFINLFVMICRLGRSLGVHLLLATQRLDEGRVHQLEAHLSYRIGLRVLSSSESRSLLGVTDAYETPLAPGTGFLKTDTMHLTRFKAAYVSGKVRRRGSGPRVASGRVLREIVPLTHERLPIPEPTLAEEREEDESRALAERAGTRSVLEVMADRLAGGPPAHRVWLPPLDAPPVLDELFGGLAVQPGRGLGPVDPGPELVVPVGIVDKPFEQRWEMLVADLAGPAGHVAVVGGARSGKSTMIRTLLLALALTHTPEQVQFYCLDFGGGGLSSLVGLPHLGGMAARTDLDQVNRTLAEVAEVMAGRERSLAAHGADSIAAYRRMRAAGQITDDAFGDVFLVTDGWYTVRAEFEHLDAAFQDIAARGLGLGVHLVVTSTRWAELRPWLRDALGTRFELRLGDPIDSMVGSRVAATVPAVPGRGITTDGMHFLGAVPQFAAVAPETDPAQATQEVVRRIRDEWQGAHAPAVRTLPLLLDATELPGAQGDDVPSSSLRLPLGLSEDRLEAVWHDFGQAPHLMVFGDREAGKTNLLRVVARAVTERFSPEGARLILADYRRELYDCAPAEYLLGTAVSGQALDRLLADSMEALAERVPDADIAPDRMARRDWWSGPRLFVLVDDYELVASSGSQTPLARLGELLPMGADIGLHLVVARSTGGASRAMMDPVIRRLWDIGTPTLMFSCPKEEGTFLGTYRPQQLPAGRANYLTRRGTTLLQTGFLADGAPEAS